LRLRLDHRGNQRDFTVICRDRIKALEGAERINASSTQLAGKSRIAVVDVYCCVLDNIADTAIGIIFEQKRRLRRIKRGCKTGSPPGCVIGRVVSLWKKTDQIQPRSADGTVAAEVREACLTVVGVNCCDAHPLSAPVGWELGRGVVRLVLVSNRRHE